MRARRARLLPNIAANLMGQFVLLCLGIVAVKLVFGHLGRDALGIVLFVQTLNLVLTGVLDLGVTSVTVREVAAHGDDEPTYVRDLVRTASALYWGAFLLLALTLIAAAPLISTRLLRLQEMDPGTASTVLRILGVAALTALPRALYVSLFRGLQRMALSNSIDVGIGVLQQIGTVVILALGGNLLAVVLWLAAGYLLGIAAYLLGLARLMPWSGLVPGWSRAAVRRNIRFSAHMTWISAAGVIHTYVDKLAVSALLPIATFGSYAFASSIVARGAIVTASVADAAYPSLSSLAHRNRVRLLAQYFKLQDLVCFGTIPVFGAIALLGPPLLRAVFGIAVARSLLFPVAALCLGYYLNGTLMIPYLHSLAVGKPEITSRLTLIALAIVVPVTVGSVAVIGVSGASFGYLAYHLFFYAVGVPRYCRECLGIPVMSWYAPVSKALALAGATYGVAALTLAFLHIADWPGVGAAVIVASAIFAVVAYRLIDPTLRETMQALRRGGWQEVLGHAA